MLDARISEETRLDVNTGSNTYRDEVYRPSQLEDLGKVVSFFASCVYLGNKQCCRVS